MSNFGVWGITNTAGIDNDPGNAQWRIEKRDLVTGELVTDFGTDGVIQFNLGDTSNELPHVLPENYGFLPGGGQCV